MRMGYKTVSERPPTQAHQSKSESARRSAISVAIATNAARRTEINHAIRDEIGDAIARNIKNRQKIEENFRAKDSESERLTINQLGHPTIYGMDDDRISADIKERFFALCEAMGLKSPAVDALPEALEAFRAVVMAIQAPRQPERRERLSALGGRERWKLTDGKRRKETPLEFIERVYPDRRDYGMTQADLRQLDREAYRALHNWLQGPGGDMPVEFGLPALKDVNAPNVQALSNLVSLGISPRHLVQTHARLKRSKPEQR